MTTVSTEQTRADLEALLASLDKGWACLASTHWETKAHRLFGASAQVSSYLPSLGGGCLFQQMYALTTAPYSQELSRQGLLCLDGHARRNAMVEALGFPNNGSLYQWNDDPTRTWAEVKERVKDAIGRL